MVGFHCFNDVSIISRGGCLYSAACTKAPRQARGPGAFMIITRLRQAQPGALAKVLHAQRPLDRLGDRDLFVLKQGFDKLSPEKMQCINACQDW